MFTTFVRALGRVKLHTGIEKRPRLSLVSSAKFWAMNESLTQSDYVKDESNFIVNF
jgi:hypothetical protein